MIKSALRRYASVALLLVVACAGTPPRPAGGIAAGDYGYLKERMSWEIAKAIDDNDLASVAIAVVDDDEVVWEQGFGQPDPAKDKTATPDTVYRIGSVSKLFTAVAIMQLVDLGLVDLDAPVTTYLPDFALLPPPPFHPESEGWALEQITVRTMMTHHSGIPGDRFAGMIAKNPVDYHELPALLAEMHASHPVGLVNSYSNNAIALLGLVVEAASGQLFETYVQQNVLDLVGMPTASWTLTPELRKQYAPPHGKGKVQPHYDLSVRPAGTLFSSVHEMTAFARMLIARGQTADGMVLDQEVLTSMWVRQNADVALDLDVKVGLVFFLDLPPVPGAKQVVSHNGATLYHRAALIVLPEEKLATVVLSNSAEAPTGKLAKQAIALALESKLGVPFDEAPPEPPEEIDALSPETLKAMTGKWDTALGYVTLDYEGPGLLSDPVVAFEALNNTFELQPVEGGGFTLVVKLFGFFPFQPDELASLVLTWEKIGSRDVIVATGPDGRRSLFGSRVDPPKPNKVWREAKGLYRVKDNRGDAPLFKAVRLDTEDDVHRFFLIRDDEEGPAVPFALGPISDEEAFVLGLGRNRGDTLRLGDHEGKPSVWFSGYRFEREEAPAEN